VGNQPLTIGKPDIMRSQSTSNCAKSQPDDRYQTGVVSVDEVYTLGEFKLRTGLTDSGLRAAKRKGLRLFACGKRRFLAGAEFLRFLESQGSSS
jgi:hypothetical protein